LAYEFGLVFGAFVAISLGHVVIGGFIFAKHGGPRLTATGIYFAGVAVYVGLAGIHRAFGGEEAGLEPVFRATLAIFLGNILFLWWRFRRPEPEAGLVQPARVAPDAGPRTIRLGLAFLVVSVLGEAVAGEALLPLLRALAFTGVAALFVGVIIPSQTRVPARRIVALVLTFVGMLLYLSVFFDGFGRLNLLALALTALVLDGVYRPTPWHKRVVLVGAIPALVLAGMIGSSRVDRPLELSVTDVVISGKGLESGTEPLLTFAELAELDHTAPEAAFPRQYGITFYEALVNPIPAEFFPGKPYGLGFRLTLHLLPQYAPAGHSIAPLAFGEWYLNFSWLGFVLVPPFLAWAFRSLDDWQWRIVQSGVQSRADLLAMLIMAVLVGGLTNFTWGGLQPYVSRSGIQALVLLGVWAAVRSIDNKALEASA
jgi:hypothetical protein